MEVDNVANHRSNPPETPDTPIEMVNQGSLFNPPAVVDTPLVENVDVEMECDDHVQVQPFTAEYFHNKSVCELSRYSWTGSQTNQRYLKGCHWSPDGTCILTAVNGEGMHVVELPRDLYAEEVPTGERPVDILESAVHIKEAGIVYDFCWYPLMNSGQPNTCW